MNSNLASRQATTADLEVIVRVHEAAFDGYFLTLLGRRFLRELYGAFIAERNGICRVTEVEVAPGQLQVAGFVAGTSKPGLFFRNLLFSRGLHFALAAVPALLRHPMVVFPRLLRSIRYRGGQPSVLKGAALLSSLGVHPASVRLGLGRKLVEDFCADAGELGARVVYLTTDWRENNTAKRFYEHAGFRLLTTQRNQNGRVMNTYLRPVATREHS